MANKGYTTNADVAAYLGTTFTGAQPALCDAMIGAAEDFIDATTGRAWAVPAVVNELHYGIEGQILQTRQAPISAVTAISARSIYGGAEWALAGTDYEIADASRGIILLPLWPSYDRVSVSYTVVPTVDASIVLAAKMLAAFWMRPALEGINSGIKSYTVGAELSVTYQDMVGTAGVPIEVMGILEKKTARRRGFLFA